MVATSDGDISGTTTLTAIDAAKVESPSMTIGDAAIFAPPPSATVASPGMASSNEGSLDTNGTASSMADFSTTFA